MRLLKGWIVRFLKTRGGKVGNLSEADTEAERLQSPLFLHCIQVRGQAQDCISKMYCSRVSGCVTVQAREEYIDSDESEQDRDETENRKPGSSFSLPVPSESQVEIDCIDEPGDQ